MDQLEKRTIAEVALYVLHKTGGLTMYHLMKTIYFAHRSFVAKHGFPMVADDFRALQHGPVPMWLYNEIKKMEKSHFLGSFVTPLADDASGVLLSERDCDYDYISPAMIEELDSSIDKYSKMDFQQLKTLSHDEYWKRSSENRGIIPIDDIARSGGASEGMIEYINEGLDIQLALS